MAYPGNETIICLLATAAQTNFNGPFKLFESSDVKIYLTPTGQDPDPLTDILTEGLDYTITISGDGNTFTLTLINAATAGDIITMELDIPNSRTSDFGVAGPFDSKRFNLQLDKITALINQLGSTLKKRGLLYNINEDINIGQTKLPKLAANETWTANASGNLTSIQCVTETCSLLRSQLISQTIGAPGTDNVGYNYTALGGATFVSNYLKSQAEENKIGITTGGSTVYLLSLSLGLTSYYDGMKVLVKFNATNAIDPTINIDNLGAKQIKHVDGTQVLDNDLKTDFYYLLAYDGTNFRILSQTISLNRNTLTPDFNNVTIANYLATNHEIINSVGKCTDSTNAIELNVSAQLIKDLSTVWAEGSGAGGRASAVSLSADTFYYYFAIVKIDGQVDFGFDTSLTASNLLADASNYSYYRYIETIKTDSSTNIHKFKEYLIGRTRYFLYLTPILSINTSVPDVNAVTLVLDTPPGIQSLALINIMTQPATGGGSLYLSSMDAIDLVPSATVTPLATLTVDGGGVSFHKREILTDTSRQIRLRASTSFPLVVRIVTLGWKI